MVDDDEFMVQVVGMKGFEGKLVGARDSHSARTGWLLAKGSSIP